MTQKNRTLEGKNRTLGGGGGQKSSKIVGHHLCTFPYYLCNLQLIVGCVIKIQALRHQVFVVVFVCIITFRVWSSLAWKKDV